QADAEATEARAGQMGRKAIVPYAMYRVHGFISPSDARRTGFGLKDLGFMWEALARMFDVDHSASRGEMSTVALFAFEHTDPTGIGCCRSKELFGRVQCQRKDGITAPRSEGD